MAIVKLLAAAMVLLTTGISAETDKPEYPAGVQSWIPTTPILPPIPQGQRPHCDVRPDRDVILRAMPPVSQGVPYIYEVVRDDIDISVECRVDQVDPPRFFPLVGPAQLHHCHYKCTVHFTETVTGEYPLPFQVKNRRVEVVYIDRDHLHLYVGTTEQQSMIRNVVREKP